MSGGSLSNWTAVSSTVYTATFTPETAPLTGSFPSAVMHSLISQAIANDGPILTTLSPSR